MTENTPNNLQDQSIPGYKLPERISNWSVGTNILFTHQPRAAGQPMVLKVEDLNGNSTSIDPEQFDKNQPQGTEVSVAQNRIDGGSGTLRLTLFTDTLHDKTVEIPYDAAEGQS